MSFGRCCARASTGSRPCRRRRRHDLARRGARLLGRPADVSAGYKKNANPTDWLAVTVEKGTANDHFLSGSYLGPLPTAMRALRVVLSPSVDAGKALVLDTAHSELLVVDGFSVEIG